MGRTREFVEDEVLAASAAAFVAGGYEGTSIDELVTATGLHRGSLYKAYASKRGLFLVTLQRHVQTHFTGLPASRVGRRRSHLAEFTGAHLDLLLVAALERGQDVQVAALVRLGLGHLERALAPGADPDPPARAVQMMGERLYARLIPAAETGDIASMTEELSWRPSILQTTI